MNTPPEALQWLEERCTQHLWASVVEARTITHQWKRHTGGRIMSAELSASIEPASAFHLAVEADGIEFEYVAAAKNGAITALIAQSWSPVFLVRLRLFNFKPEEAESSYAAFYAVAKEAVNHLLGIPADTVHNIQSVLQNLCNPHERWR